ncbi:aldehyde dehydrogenase [Coniophora puteana RWD-64-598 SS2]|uniref:Aldehyde dehydrogenase n=1 Tax=Coniophora puteana (strain RWD-64-598) TaxID=741705 RepID=A0A5M3MD45_CONPW|nr:aldehyde dehydrogenase [Coniophora puteana RWD-64-598 SS2]EIW76927.1 aldehyde dehydrogenase [Coniophora puteana RWD-64-598 SS2]
MSNTNYTPLSDIPKIRNAVKDTFKSGTTRPIAWRKHQLLQLARLSQENADAIVEALSKDLRKPRLESLMIEVGLIVDRSIKSAAQLDEWAAPEHPEVVDFMKPWQPTIYKAPKGAVLIFAPWNYPYVLLMQPFMGAIAAGCTAVIKPSEVSSHTAELIKDLLPKYLDNDAFKVVTGGPEESTALLEQQWDHIFYTGNGTIGRVIATAGAKYLTPVTLELGGKAPTYVDDTTDLDLAAKRILWGKLGTAGQLCVAPDYVLCHRSKVNDLAAAFKKQAVTFFPNGALGSPDIAKIISKRHHDRLKGLLSRTKGQVVFGGRTDDATLDFEPTIVVGVDEKDSLMEEELFGPIMPIIAVEDLDDAIRFITNRPHALVLYAFTDHQSAKQRLIEETQSGAIVFNDTVQQLAVGELPNAGVGASGYGEQFLKYSFSAFTQLRSSIDMPKEAEPFLALRYPPYTEQGIQVLGGSAFQPIPASTPTGK